MGENSEINLYTIYDELFGLLRDKRQEVVQGSLELLLDQSETESLSEYLLTNPEHFRRILLLIGSDYSLISECTLKILINLSQKIEVGRELSSSWGAIEYSMNNLKEQAKPGSTVPYHLGLNLMLVSNLTRTSEGRARFFTKSRQSKGSYLPYLLECLSNPRKEEERGMAINIINNFTSCGEGRAFLFESDIGIEILNIISGLLLAADKSKLKVVDGLMSIVTHICVDKNMHQIITKKHSDVIQILCCLIYPGYSHIHLRNKKSSNALLELQNKTIYFDSRCKTNSRGDSSNDTYNDDSYEEYEEHGNETIDSVKDDTISEFIRKNSVGPIHENLSKDVFDCILVLTSTPEGRIFLREIGAYEVLRVWHLYESNNEITSGIEDIIHLLVYSEDELLQQDMCHTTNII
ncbi:hypothetical protein OJ253_3743 [Cryptosporidium canis]|uniref:Protein HGH1 C-terminal domain-containing protein n=1 Tax=Cryptosporidium canis TaxID=195482 RepID=A0A9D5DGU1_9CRYT|nr:hypothetical protein OJ253_3743 [Cryptosporidium canis]